MPGDIIILNMCTINCNHMMYGSWNIDCERHNFLSFWTISSPFIPQTTPKIKIKNIIKKMPVYIYYFAHLYHKCQLYIWYMVPEIWSMTDRMFCYFEPFFAHLSLWHHRKIKILKKWDMAHNGICCYFSFFCYILSFCLPNSTENQNITKTKKTPGDIII